MDDLSEVMIISLNGVFIAPLCLLLNEKADKSVQKEKVQSTGKGIQKYSVYGGHQCQWFFTKY